MRYENNRILRDYLDRGAAGAFREHLRHPAFELDPATFAATLDEVRAQHPHLGHDEAEARAVFRLLTSGAPPEIAAEPAEVAVALPSRTHRLRDWAQRMAPAVWLWVRILWAVAVLAALCAIAGRAEPDPDANVVGVADRLHALEVRPPQLFQLSNGAARVQFQSSGAWSFVSSGTPFPITCVSGCSAAGAFSDNSAFTVGSTAIVPIGALYDSGTAPAISSGNAGRVRMDANSYLYTDCVVGCSGGSTTPSDSFTNPTTAGVQYSLLGGFNGTTWDRLRDDSNKYLYVDVGNSSLSVTGTFWQATQPVSGTFWQALQPVNVSTWAGGTLGSMANYGTSPGAVLAPGVNAYITNTVPVSGTFWQTTQPVSCTAANCPVNLADLNGTALGAPSNYGTSPGAVEVPGVNAFVTNTVSENLAQVAGNTAATAATGVQKVGIVGNAGAAVDGATGGAPPANTIYVGGLGSGATGGELIGLPVADTYKAINISTATTTLIVTGVSGRQVRISAQHMIAAGADNVAWIEGTGATCGTGTAGMAGGTTSSSGYNFAANGGIAEGSGVGTILSTVTTGDSVCLVTSAAVQLSGGISYTIY